MYLTSKMYMLFKIKLNYAVLTSTDSTRFLRARARVCVRICAEKKRSQATDRSSTSYSDPLSPTCLLFLFFPVIVWVVGLFLTLFFGPFLGVEDAFVARLWFPAPLICIYRIRFFYTSAEVDFLSLKDFSKIYPFSLRFPTKRKSVL